MILPRRGRHPHTLLVAIFVGCLLLVYYHLQSKSSYSSPYPRPSYPNPSSTGRPAPATKGSHGSANKPSPPPDNILRFWADLLDVILENKPRAPPVKIDHPFDRNTVDPNKLNEGDVLPDRGEYLALSATDRDLIANAHTKFVQAAKKLAPQLPFKKHTRGIAMTAGGKYIGNAILSLLMLRRTGSTLPVQLFLDSVDDYNMELCESTLVELNVECRIMTDIWKSTPHMPVLKKYQFKVFSLLYTTFEDVLFIDADCFPIHNPDHLFDVEPFRSNGLIVWPDLWLSTASPSFYAVAGIKDAPSVALRRSSESGILLYRRSMQAESLLLATYYNFYGPDYYYPLLCQGSHGEGDKETFLHAALAVGKPFYDVRTNMRFLGRWINGSFETAGMLQADPMQDFELRGRQPSTAKPTRPESDELRARVMFAHHNIVKLDMNNLADSMQDAFRLNENGKLSRLWGDESGLNKDAGYDVERAMWEEIIRVDCHQSFLRDCKAVRKYYETVFANEIST